MVYANDLYVCRNASSSYGNELRVIRKDSSDYMNADDDWKYNTHPSGEVLRIQRKTQHKSEI